MSRTKVHSKTEPIYQVILLKDTFREFAHVLKRQFSRALQYATFYWIAKVEKPELNKQTRKKVHAHFFACQIADLTYCSLHATCTAVYNF